MKARAKDVLQTLKKEIPSNLLSDIERVLTDLYLIRDSESKTEEYYNRFLHADYRYQIRDRDYQFNYNEGEIDKNIAKEFRFHLLKLVKDDPSFGYIYYLLGVEQNCHWGSVVYDCVPKEYNILFHIKYTLEDHLDAISNLPDSKKLEALSTARDECKKSNFLIDLKQEFIEKCEIDICAIERRMAPTNITPEPSFVDKSLANTSISSNEEKGELFARDLCDFIEKEIKGVQYSSNHHAIEIFNCPKEYGCKIRPIHKGRTLYLIKILYKYLIHINKQEEAETWIKGMATGLSVTRDDIIKSTLRTSTEDTRFKAILLKQFESRGMTFNIEESK